MRLSKSAFMQWEFCPRGYKYAFIDRLPFRPTVPMRMGSAFHDYADGLFRLLDYDDLATVGKKSDIEEIFLEAAVQIEAPAAIAHLVKNFVDFEVQRYQTFTESYTDPIRLYKPLHLEQKLVALESYPDIDLVGIIDRMDLLERGTMALIEYKSGNLNEKRVERELLFYTILVEKCNEINDTDFPRVSHLVGYSPAGNKTFVTEVKERKKKTVEKRILRMYREVTDGIFEAKENPFCGTCRGVDICMDSDVEVETIFQLCSEAAYTAQEIAIILSDRASNIKAMLSDLALEGKVKRAVKGNKTYWYNPEKV